MISKLWDNSASVVNKCWLLAMAVDISRTQCIKAPSNLKMILSVIMIGPEKK